MAGDTKWCPKCEETLPTTAFQRCASKASGYQSHCRACRTAAAVEYRERTRDRRLAYNREYAATHKAEKKAYYLSRRDEFTARMRERHAALTSDERERERDRLRAHYQANKAEHRAKGKAWAEANQERVEAYRKRYYRENYDVILHHSAIRRMRKKQIDGPVTRIVPLVVLERDDGICGICGTDVDPANFHVDHIVPLSRGGGHHYGNVQVAHPACNRKKYNRMPEEVAA